MKPSTSSRSAGVELGDDGAPEAGAVLEQVVHDQGAEDQAAGQANQCADAGDHLGEEAAADRRGRLLGCRPSGRPTTPDRPRTRRPPCASAASTEAPISSACSITPRTVATTTPVIKASRPRTTTPAARVGLNLWRSRPRPAGLKTTARTAANISGSTISLTAAERGDHDDRRHHEPDEAPGPHPHLGTEAPAFHRDAGAMAARSGGRDPLIRLLSR